MDIWYVWFLIALACLKAIYFLILVIFDFIKEHLKEWGFKNNFKENLNLIKNSL